MTTLDKTPSQGEAATPNGAVSSNLDSALQHLEVILRINELKTEITSRFADADSYKKQIDELQREIERIKAAETENIRTIEKLSSQESTCNSLIIFLQEMGQQLEQFSESFKAVPDAKMFQQMIEAASNQLLAKISGEAGAKSENGSKAELSRRIYDKMNDIQFQLEHFIAQQMTMPGAGGADKNNEIVQLMDLKIDRLIQHTEFIQQDFQDHQFKLAGLLNTEISAALQSPLTAIQTGLKSLQEEFEGKLKGDQQKDRLIDNLHKELQDYKLDIQKKFLKSIVMDIIQIIDNIRRVTNYYHQSPLESDPEKLMKLLEEIPTDLEDLFFLQGITPYTCDSAVFDPTRQRVLKKIQTDDFAKDKTIAESMRPGYEWDGKIIRPEMIAAYVYSSPTQENIQKPPDQEPVTETQSTKTDQFTGITIAHETPSETDNAHSGTDHNSSDIAIELSNEKEDEASK